MFLNAIQVPSIIRSFHDPMNIQCNFIIYRNVLGCVIHRVLIDFVAEFLVSSIIKFQNLYCIRIPVSFALNIYKFLISHYFSVHTSLSPIPKNKSNMVCRENGGKFSRIVHFGNTWDWSASRSTCLIPR